VNLPDISAGGGRRLWPLAGAALALGAVAVPHELTRLALLGLTGFVLAAAWRPKRDVASRIDGSDASPTDLADLPVAVLKLDRAGRVIFANPVARRHLGGDLLEGRMIGDLAEGVLRPLGGVLKDIGRTKGCLRTEMARAEVQGEERFFQVAITPGGGRTGGYLAVLTDATELKTLEAQFVQSQKMQAVGQLAGGVAHDFNNLLTAINGHCDLLLMRNPGGTPDHDDLTQISLDVARAAALVRQLLAYSRKQTLQLRRISLAQTLDELAHLLTRLLSEKVRLDIRTAPGLSPVRADERQFEQVIMNLVVNARDAMPKGGTIHITARNLTLTHPTERGHARIPAGRWVVVEVEDSGTGMTEAELAKIFEPFYTTKKPGEGTGLGLSTAYGIVKQTGGYIFADSVLGEGSRFSILLPAEDGPVAETRPPLRAVPAVVPPAAVTLTPTAEAEGRRRILLAEDEAGVRSFAARALRLKGFSVTEADSGEAALGCLDKGETFELFISDVIMPGIDGPGWVRRARERSPSTPVLFVSGYAEDSFDNGLPDIDHAVFLPKPYSLADLTRLADDLTLAGRRENTRGP
jgi:two-component system cell cycle sensor histidine kinase/response regulator CckA